MVEVKYFKTGTEVFIVVNNILIRKFVFDVYIDIKKSKPITYKLSDDKEKLTGILIIGGKDAENLHTDLKELQASLTNQIKEFK